MTNAEKDELTRLIRHCHRKGHNINYAVDEISKRGFKESTIRKYFKALAN